MTNYSSEIFPKTRLRRNRQAPWIRNLTAETVLTPNDLILPLFVIKGQNQEEPIADLPGISRFSIDLAVKKAQEAQKAGINAIMLFPVTKPELKTADGKEALNKDNLICRAVREIKNKVPEIGIICDVALDPYTSHGHDGIIGKNDDVDNDATVEILCQQALIQAQAGCDAVAPSDMMDGRIGKIRETLEQNNLQNTLIISYAAKYASNFYGPFRHAVGSADNFNSDNSLKDKKTYQMDFRNSDEAMREIALDVSEGTDAIIIKPGMPYLDIVKQAKENFRLPIFSYQVSGEYAMLKHAANAGAFDFNEAMMESLICFKRAGANAIITYAAVEIAKKIMING